MKVEDALEDSDVQKIKKSVDEQDNEYETFFTLLESAISRKEYNLKIFATALKNQNSTQEFGKRLLSEYCKCYVLLKVINYDNTCTYLDELPNNQNLFRFLLLIFFILFSH